MEVNDRKYIKVKYDGLLPISLFCGLIAMLTGPLPGAVFAYFSGAVFYPFFLVTPLLIALFSHLFKGCRDIRAFAVILFFSLIGTYITGLTIQAAIYVRVYNMSFFNVPILTMLTVLKRDVLPTGFSPYVFSILFTITGAVCAWDLLYYKETAIS